MAAAAADLVLLADPLGTAGAGAADGPAASPPPRPSCSPRRAWPTSCGRPDPAVEQGRSARTRSPRWWSAPRAPPARGRSRSEPTPPRSSCRPPPRPLYGRPRQHPGPRQWAPGVRGHRCLGRRPLAGDYTSPEDGEASHLRGGGYDTIGDMDHGGRRGLQILGDSTDALAGAGLQRPLEGFRQL